MKRITENTNIPLKWVFALLSMSGSGLIVAMSVGIWTTKLEARTTASEEKIQEFKVEKKDFSQEFKDIKAILDSINTRVARIEGKMDTRSK